MGRGRVLYAAVRPGPGTDEAVPAHFLLYDLPVDNEHTGLAEKGNAQAVAFHRDPGNQHLTAKERETGFTDMMEIALKTAVAL